MDSNQEQDNQLPISVASPGAWLRGAIITAVKGAIGGLLAIGAFALVMVLWAANEKRTLSGEIPFISFALFGGLLGFFYYPLPSTTDKNRKLYYICLSFVVGTIFSYLSIYFDGAKGWADAAIYFGLTGGTIILFVTALSQFRGQLDDPIGGKKE